MFKAEIPFSNVMTCEDDDKVCDLLNKTQDLSIFLALQNGCGVSNLHTGSNIMIKINEYFYIITTALPHYIGQDETRCLYSHNFSSAEINAFTKEYLHELYVFYKTHSFYCVFFK